MVDESTKLILRKRSRQSILKTVLVLSVLFLFIGTTIIFIVLFNPNNNAVANPLATPTNVTVTENGTQNNKQYTLSFREVTNADYYAVYIFSSIEEAENARDLKFADISPVLTFNGTSKDVTIYMQEIGQYYFSVQAICRRIPSYSSDPSDPLLCTHAVYYYLSSPSLTVTETKSADSVSYQCSWEPITEASSYEIDVIRADIDISLLSAPVSVTGNDYVLSEDIVTRMNQQQTTDFIVKIRAISDNEYIQPSNWGQAEAHTYKVIEQPVLEYSYGIENNVETYKLLWQSLDFAEYFDVYINGVLVTTIQDASATELNINEWITGEGVYSARIVAQSDSVYVTGTASEEISFTVYYTSPVVTGLYAERSGSVINVRWNKDSTATTYYIYVRDEEGGLIIPANSTEEYSGLSDSGQFSVPISWSAEGYYSIGVVAQRNNQYYYPSTQATVVYEFDTLKLATPSLRYVAGEDTLIWSLNDQTTGNPTQYDNNGFRIRLWTLDSEGGEVEVSNFTAGSNTEQSRSYNISSILELNGVNTYYASVQALGGYLIWEDSEESDDISFKYTQPLGTVQNVTVNDDGSGLTSDNPVLSWNKVDNAIGYSIAINDTLTGITVTAGEMYSISEGYTISEEGGVILVTGWNTYFENLVAGTYTFKVKALADASDTSVYTDGEWSAVALFQLSRVLPKPVIYPTYQDNGNKSNAFLINWYRLNGEQTIYDENLQTFNIYVNGTKVVSSLLPSNARVDGENAFYQYNIGDYMVPGSQNTIIVEAVAYGVYESCLSDTSTGVSYYYYLQSAYDTKYPVKIVGELNQSTGNVIYNLYFFNLKFANSYEFTFNNDSEQYTQKNVFSRSATSQSSISINPDWIESYKTNTVRVVFSYNDALSIKDTGTPRADAGYIVSYDWNYTYVDEAHLAPVENLSYDGGSRFSWTYDSEIIEGVGHFTYSYYFTGLSLDTQTGTSTKESYYMVGNVQYYYVDVDFDYAGEILFSVIPISSSVKRANGDAVTDTFDVKTTLDIPADITMAEDANGLYISWTPVNNVNLTNSYTVQLYSDGVQVSTDLIVGNSSDKVKVYCSAFGIEFNDSSTYYAKVKANAHTPTSDGLDYYYRASDWGVSNEYAFTPKIYAPIISITDNVLKVLITDYADAYLIYYRTAQGSTEKTNISSYLTPVANSNYITYDLDGYFNTNTVATGVYYISVIAKNTEWNKTSSESDIISYTYAEKFSQPVVNSVNGGTSKITMDWDAVTGTNYGNGAILPAGYKIVIGLSNRAYDRLVTVQVLTDLTVGYKVKVGSTTYSPTDTTEETNSTVYTYQIGTLTVYSGSFVLVYNAGILSASSDYVADFTVLANTEAYFADSDTASFEFTCYSVAISAPVIYFYDTSTSSLVNTYQRATSTYSDSLLIYILKQTHSSTFDIVGTNLFEDSDIIRLSKLSGQEVIYNGNTYKVYQLNKSDFPYSGIYQITVKYNANKAESAGESAYSNTLYLYRSIPVKSASNLTLTTRSSGTTYPVELTVTLPTSQIDAYFRGFSLTVSTTETTPRVTSLTLGTTGSYSYSRSDNATTKITTITYQIPINEISGFGATWATLDYDFKFDIKVLGHTAVSGLVATYGLPAQCLDSFSFYGNSNSINAILNTSARAPQPADLALNETTGRIIWTSSGSQATYYYMYYAWDLTDNTYTLYYFDGSAMATQTLVLTDGVLYLSDGETALSSIVQNSTDWWLSTPYTYFAVQNYSAGAYVVYGVYIYAEIDGHASDIVNETLAKTAVLPAFTTSDIVIIYNSSQVKYYLTWTDIYSTFDEDLVPDKDSRYSVIFNGNAITLDSVSPTANTVYQDGLVYLDITSLISGRGPYSCRITLSAFSVTAEETDIIHAVLLGKTVEAYVYSPIGIDDTVQVTSVSWNSDKTICTASWEEPDANVTAYNLLVTADTVTVDQMKDGEGNLYTSETSELILGNKVVSVNEINVNNIQYDITEWLKSLSITAGKYKLWVCVADDAENNIVSAEALDNYSYGSFTYYALCNSVTDLKYNFTINGTTRTKTVSWANDLMNGVSDYMYKYVVYKLELKDASQNLIELSSGVYALYFMHEDNLNYSAYNGFTLYDATLVGGRVSIDVTAWFENINAGQYELLITACPSSNVSDFKNSDPVSKSISNNRQLVLNSSLQYMSILVDSYIDAVTNGVVTYTETGLVSSYLSGSNFNTKTVSLLEDLPEGATGLGVIVYKYQDDAWVLISENLLYTGSSWKLNLDAGLYYFNIYALGDNGNKYYSNSAVKEKDLDNLEVYTRHQIDETNSSLKITYDENDNITGVSITHGISQPGSEFRVYCYKYDGTLNGKNVVGDEIWVSGIKTTTSDTMVDILSDILANSDMMSFGDYVFKVQWLATTAEKANNVLDSDVTEANGIRYEHKMNVSSPQLQKDTDGSIVLKGYDFEGYITSTDLKWSVASPLIDGILVYQVKMWQNRNLSDLVNYYAYVKVTYGLNGGLYVASYTLLNSGDYVSDPEFTLTDVVLTYNMLSFINGTYYTVGNYYLNAGLVEVIKVFPDNSTDGNVVSLGTGAWYYNLGYEEIYTHQDIYATRADKWNIDDAGSDLYISNLAINEAGVLSWTFTDNGSYNQASYFEIKVNDNRSLVEYSTSQTGYSINLSEMLWADKNTDTNNNNVTIRLYAENTNWIATPVIYIISNSGLSAVYDESFVWETNLGAGGEILNNTWNTDTQNVLFKYVFNQYYLNDSQLYTDDAQLNTMIQYNVEILFSTDSFGAQNFATAYANGSLANRAYISINQSQLEDWIISINSSDYAMTFIPAGENSYKFNLESLLTYMDSSTGSEWIDPDTGTLHSGYYYLNISLVDDAIENYNSDYDNGSIWEVNAYVKAPWKILNTAIIDGHENTAEQTVILLSDNPSDDEKYAWADDIDKSIYLEFDVEKINGTIPSLYQVMVYYKLRAGQDATISTYDISDFSKIHNIGDNGNGTYKVRLDITDLFETNFINHSGLFTFRVIGRANDVAKDSNLKSAVKSEDADALENYVRLPSVTVRFQADKANSAVKLLWSWNFPEGFLATILGNITTANIEPTLLIYNYKTPEHSDTYGEDSFNMVDAGIYPSVSVALNGIIGTTGIYTHLFSSSGSKLSIQRSLTETEMVYNYLTYQVLVPEGANYLYLLNSDTTEQTVSYIDGYEAPAPVTDDGDILSSLYVNGTNEYIYTLEDEYNLEHPYNQLSMKVLTESFVNEGTYNGNIVKYSYVQMRVYNDMNRITPLNGAKGIILKISYYSNTSTPSIAAVELYNIETGETTPISFTGGSINLTSTFSITFTIKVQLNWLFGDDDADNAHTPATLFIDYNIYIPGVGASGNDLSQYNDIYSQEYAYNVRMMAPAIEDIEFQNNENDDTPDIGDNNGNPYLIYTGDEPDFTLKLTLREVSDYADAVYITVANGISSAAESRSVVINLRKNGALCEGITQTGDNTFVITITKNNSNTSELFSQIIELIPNKLYFYVQAVNTEYTLYDTYKKGIFTAQLTNIGPDYVDSYRSDIEDTYAVKNTNNQSEDNYNNDNGDTDTVYRELAKPEFYFGFTLINDDSQWTTESATINSIVTNLIGDETDYQVANPYAAIDKYTGTSSNEDSDTDDEDISQNITFIIQLKYDLNGDGSYTSNEITVISDISLATLMSKNSDNQNLYSYISALVQKAQGKTVIVTLYATQGGAQYWLDQNYETNENNGSESKSIMFYHNVQATGATVNESSIVFSDEETKNSSSVNTGLLKPESIPLTWSYSSDSPSQTASGYRVIVSGKNRETDWNYIKTESDARTLNLVVDQYASSNWYTNTFNFKNWANVDSGKSQGVWNISVTPYYKIDLDNDSFYIVYGSPSTYEYSLRLKLSNLRNIDTTYSFTTAFSGQLSEGMANMDNASKEEQELVAMVQKEPVWANNNGSAVNTSVSSGFGNPIATYCSQFAIQVQKGSGSWYTLNSTDRGLHEFSPTNLILCLNTLMNNYSLAGGEYNLRYMLTGVSGITVTSDWSDICTFTYCKAYDGSDTTMSQSGTGLAVNTPNGVSSLFKAYHLIQYGYYSSSRIDTEVTNSTSNGLINRFDISQLDALTVKEASVYSSQLVNNFKVCNGLGYIQLGNNQVIIKASSTADAQYNVGFYKTLTATFSLPSGYGVPTLTSETWTVDNTSLKSGRIVYYANSTQVGETAIIFNSEGNAPVSGATLKLERMSVNDGYSRPNNNSSSPSDGTTQNIYARVYGTKANYIKNVTSTFNSYNYSLNVNLYNNLDSTSFEYTKGNGTYTFKANATAKVSTASYTYTLLYFAFADGNAFTGYGITSYSSNKTHTETGTGGEVEFGSGVYMASVAANCDIWYGTTPDWLADFWHDYSYGASISYANSDYSRIKAYISFDVRIDTYRWSIQEKRWPIIDWPISYYVVNFHYGTSHTFPVYLNSTNMTPSYYNHDKLNATVLSNGYVQDGTAWYYKYDDDDGVVKDYQGSNVHTENITEFNIDIPYEAALAAFNQLYSSPA